MRAEAGHLRMIFREDGLQRTLAGEAVATEYVLIFYTPAFLLVADGDGTPNGAGANFISDERGRLAWLRLGGQLFRHEL